MRRTTSSIVFIVTVLVLNACASSGPPLQSSDQSVLTREEIQATGVANLYQAIERLRPRWLEIRSARSINSSVQIAVFLNRSYVGEPEVLKTYTLNSVARIRYLDGPTATASLSGFDSRHVEGAIVLETTVSR